MENILRAALLRNYHEVIRLVQADGDVNAQNSSGVTVLHYAAVSASLEIVKYLVKHGADVNCKDERNWSVLCYAVKSGSLEIVKYLVEHGADLNGRNECNTSVLHFAAQSGSLETVKYLVEHGANVNCKDEDNCSVLHYATRSSSLETVKYLVEHGGDVYCNDMWNESVLHSAAKYGSLEMVKYLVEHGADVNIRNETIVDCLFRRVKMKDIHDCDNSGRSLFSIACYIGNTPLVRALLKYKVDVRKEKELVCGNEEIVNVMNLELKKSIKHRKKIEDLSNLSHEKLQKVYITFYISHAFFKL